MTAATPLVAVAARHAADRPGDPAAADESERLSWSELVSAARATAAGLASAGVAAGDRVGLRLPNSAAFPVAALGCLWLGATFVPTSPDDPDARVRRILDDCRPRLLLCPPDTAPAGPGWPPLADPAALRTSAAPVPDMAIDPARDAYMIYTSGTTGAPKGVRISVDAFASALTATANGLRLGADTRTLCVSPFHFDGSYSGLFATLYAGGWVYAPRRDRLLFIKPFFRALAEEAINHTSFSPSYLAMVLASPRAADLGSGQLRSLGLGGEDLPPQALLRVWELAPHIRIYNLYGPTETTIQVTSYAVERTPVEEGAVPLGGPHEGVSFHVLDAGGRVVQGPGAAGELYIGGRQLMTGYWGDPALSAAVLRDDVVPGVTVYKTGDLVRVGDDGRLYFVGRADDVIKRRGVRISLTEVARALSHAEGATSAVCLALEGEDGTRIAAFVQADPGVTAEAILEAAAESLPASMVPDEVHLRDGLPMTVSGKVDRAALLASLAPVEG